MEDPEAEWPFPQQAADMEVVRNRYNYGEFSDKHFRYEVKRYAGYALIFNNTQFQHPRFRERAQSSFDVASLRRTMTESIGLRAADIDVYDNNTSEEMISILEQASKKDFTDYTCLIVVVLSYGEYRDGEAKYIIHSVDGRLTYQQLLSPFKDGKVPSLLDTPKFFIMQTERPTDDDFRHSSIPPPLSSSAEITDPDTLIIFSVDPQNVVWRQDGRGSWFIQRLCEVLQADAFILDIHQIFTRTLRLVRLDYQGYVRQSLNTRILCPRMISLLSKEFKFRWDY